jgi:hypothetical protein
MNVYNTNEDDSAYYLDALDILLVIMRKSTKGGPEH